LWNAHTYRSIHEGLFFNFSPALDLKYPVRLPYIHFYFSSMDNTIASNEVFPDQFKNPYRKDRKLGEGVVFPAVDSTYITSEITPSTNCETVWCKVNIQGS
jgi:hypothetical protein